MKLSEGILKGYKSNGGRQCVGVDLRADGAMCVAGAYLKAANGDAQDWVGWARVSADFQDAWGISPVVLNNNGSCFEDHEPFPWEHIYGMAVAAGL